MLLEGLHIPLSTPFHPDGRLNPHKLAANVARYSKSPAAGLIALAPHTGEPTFLTDEETEQALRAVADAAAPEKVLLAHISRDSVRATLALARHAAAFGYDAIVVARPAALRDSANAEVLTYFQTVADQSPLPLVLFAAGYRHDEIAPRNLATLSAHANILGALWGSAEQQDENSERSLGRLLPSLAQLQREVTVTSTFAAVTGRMRRLAEKSAEAARLSPSGLVSATALAHNPAAAATALAEPAAAFPIRTRTKKVGFQILSVACRQLIPDLNGGAVGIAPAFAACAPQSCYEVFAAWKDADQALALEKQDRLHAAAEYAEHHGPAALKFGCDLNGYCGGLPRLPHLPLTAEQRSELQQRMVSLRT